MSNNILGHGGLEWASQRKNTRDIENHQWKPFREEMKNNGAGPRVWCGMCGLLDKYIPDYPFGSLLVSEKVYIDKYPIFCWTLFKTAYMAKTV